MFPTGVGSRDAGLLIAACAAGDTSLSLLYEISHSRAQFLPQLSVFLRWLGETLCREKNIMNLEEQETYLRSYWLGERTCAKQSQRQSGNRKIILPPATGELPSAATAGRDPVQSSQNSGVLMKKESERIEYATFPTSNSFVIGKMNFKSEVCSSSSFPAEVWCGSMKSIPPGTWTN